MRFVNCTPHAINILREDGSIMTVESSGVVVRVETTQEIVGNIDGVPVVRTVFQQCNITRATGWSCLYRVHGCTPSSSADGYLQRRPCCS